MPVIAKRGRPRKVPPPVKLPILSTQVPLDWPDQIRVLMRARPLPVKISEWLREAIHEKMIREKGPA